MDFIEVLLSFNSKDVVLVVVDRLSKYGHFLILKHPTQTLAQCFLYNVSMLHGIPNTITSDRDLIFLSTFWQNFLSLQGFVCKEVPLTTSNRWPN